MPARRLREASSVAESPNREDGQIAGGPYASTFKLTSCEVLSRSLLIDDSDE
jgi:hypothetical protein